MNSLKDFTTQPETFAIIIALLKTKGKIVNNCYS